jgi:formamidopyrimidine-DNA glycosylase
MPELPEVEHVTKELQKIVAGKRIETAELLRQRLAPDIKPNAFAKKLSGAVINFVHRRGKHILIDLDNNRTLIVHLRMSGRFMLLSPDDENPKFTHAVLYFDDNTRLVFQDQRHFGLMKIVDTNKLFETKELSKLAPEPFSDEFTADYLELKMKGSKRVLKELLLDQTKVCGVGNIYASEAMYLSGINPKKFAGKISKAKIPVLFENIRNVLRTAGEMMDKIIPDPVVIGEGVYGRGVEGRWHVYDREGEPCAKCEAPIRRIKQGSRSTYYCVKCQR